MAVIATTLLTTGLTGVVTYLIQVNMTDHQARVTDRVAQVNRFIQVSQAFDPLVSTFVAEVSKSDVSPETKAAIRANLRDQRASLESLAGLLTPEEDALAERYIETLVSADTGIKTAVGPLDSRAFVQASADIAGLRPQVIDALR